MNAEQFVYYDSIEQMSPFVNCRRSVCAATDVLISIGVPSNETESLAHNIPRSDARVHARVNLNATKSGCRSAAIAQGARSLLKSSGTYVSLVKHTFRCCSSLGPVLALLPHTLHHEVAALSANQSPMSDVSSGMEVQGVAGLSMVPQVSARNE